LGPGCSLDDIFNKPVVKDGLSLLQGSLPDHLLYHTYEHTVDVLKASLSYAAEDRVGSREMELLAIAAVYHDAGFLDQSHDNEILGAERAAAAMKSLGCYSDSEISLVKTMILDTIVKASPNGPMQIPSIGLSKYLLDGDMTNLGREDFFEKGSLLQRELRISSEPDFLRNSLEILSAHKWHSEPAIIQRTAQKEANLRVLKEKLGLK
jgi:predicted metal-dependent HD superfamily phosphohydrolase